MLSLLFIGLYWLREVVKYIMADFFFLKGGVPILPLFLGGKTISAESPLGRKICQIVIDTFL